MAARDGWSAAAARRVPCRWVAQGMEDRTPPSHARLVAPFDLPCMYGQHPPALPPAGAWLVLDNTYEHFLYNGLRHHCARGPHVVHLFSFSKGYGMMGWRVGYIAFPTGDGGRAHQALLKAQDTIPICPTQASMRLALEVMTPSQPS